MASGRASASASSPRSMPSRSVAPGRRGTHRPSRHRPSSVSSHPSVASSSAAPSRTVPSTTSTVSVTSRPSSMRVKRSSVVIFPPGSRALQEFQCELPARPLHRTSAGGHAMAEPLRQYRATEPVVSVDVPAPRAHAYGAYRMLYALFVLLPIAAGLDKFAHLLVNWDQYLAPAVTATLPPEVSPHVFMLAVGV